MPKRISKKPALTTLFDRDGEPVSAGNRVEIGPHYDLWMMGAKYGVVQELESPDILVLKMDNTRIKGLRRFRASECKRR